MLLSLLRSGWWGVPDANPPCPGWHNTVCTVWQEDTIVFALDTHPFTLSCLKTRIVLSHQRFPAWRFHQLPFISTLALPAAAAIVTQYSLLLAVAAFMYDPLALTLHVLAGFHLLDIGVKSALSYTGVILEASCRIHWSHPRFTASVNDSRIFGNSLFSHVVLWSYWTYLLCCLCHNAHRGSIKVLLVWCTSHFSGLCM